MKRSVYGLVVLLNLSLTTFLLLTFFISLCLAETNILTNYKNVSYKNSIVEKNDLNISIYNKDVSKITKVIFDNVIDKIQMIYAPIINSKNGNLIIDKDWVAGMVNAYASRSGKNWFVHIYGGVARHPSLTADGLAIVVCHEVGHHMAGIPKIVTYAWASNEGQSDYYSTLKCFRKYVENENNEEFVRYLNVPVYVSNLCSKNFTNREDIAICKRTSMAAKSVADLFASLRASKKPDFTTPDQSIVGVTNNNHPDPQCRLDTLFAGALCPVSDNQDVSDFDVTIGTCTKINNYILGLRPRCWYKPSIE
ncbi:MAG: hypothetical protein HQK49_15270 [Oligoflexia bacterium]|nr:hypothetical protein [Oligoflexia bacterium]